MTPSSSPRDPCYAAVPFYALVEEVRGQRGDLVHEGDVLVQVNGREITERTAEIESNSRPPSFRTRLTWKPPSTMRHHSHARRAEPDTRTRGALRTRRISSGAWRHRVLDGGPRLSPFTKLRISTRIGLTNATASLPVLNRDQPRKSVRRHGRGGEKLVIPLGPAARYHGGAGGCHSVNPAGGHF
jgi:hypothetical protein